MTALFRCLSFQAFTMALCFFGNKLTLVAAKQKVSIVCQGEDPNVVWHLDSATNTLQQYASNEVRYYEDPIFRDKKKEPEVKDCSAYEKKAEKYNVEPKVVSRTTYPDAYKYIPHYVMRGDMECWPGKITHDEYGKCRKKSESYDNGTLQNETPVYYQRHESNTFGVNKVLHSYWVYYGRQRACDALGNGSHDEDLELVSVLVMDGKMVLVDYHQHNGNYLRHFSDVEVISERPVVKIGKYAHGSYSDSKSRCGSSSLNDGSCYSTSEYCKYFKDPRGGRKGRDWIPNVLHEAPGRITNKKKHASMYKICNPDTFKPENVGEEILFLFAGSENTCKKNPPYIDPTNRGGILNVTKDEIPTVQDLMNMLPNFGSAIPNYAKVFCLRGTGEDSEFGFRFFAGSHESEIRKYGSKTIAKSFGAFEEEGYPIDCRFVKRGSDLELNFGLFT